MLAQYESLRLKLTHIPPGEKGPTHEEWNLFPTSYTKLYNGYSDYNLGLLHGHSRTCCLDIDDLETAESIPNFKELIDAGLKYESGKPNRIKVLFRIPKKYDITLFTTHPLRYEGKIFGQFRCVSVSGTSMQDVLPPSLHPDGFQYHWIDELPKSFKDIPKLPKAIIDKARHNSRTKQVNNRRYLSEGLSFYVKVYNDYFHSKGGSLEEEIMRTGGYVDIGLGRFQRKGSNNKLAIVVYEDEFGQFGMNYSDTEGPSFIKPGAFDPYDMLVMLKFDGNEKAARYYVTKEHKKLSKLCDEARRIKEKAWEEGKETTLLRYDGIKFDADSGCPYLSANILMPGVGDDEELPKPDQRSNFAKVVKSILFHQEGVYNPDMAFWYALAFIDHLAGCGYQSVNSERTAPLYIFTAGDSSDGKSSTIQSGEKHLLAIGGKGNVDIETARLSIEEGETKGNAPIFSADFVNKRHVKNVGSAQGLEDLICSELEHGCDIIYTQDEYGLKDNGTMDSAGKAMRSLLLSYRTLSRLEAVEPRYLAHNQGNKSSKRSATYCVHFNYFTAATNETLKGVIKDSEVGMGYIQRFVGGIARSPYFGARNKVLGRTVTKKPVSRKVAKILKRIVENSNRFMGYKRTRSSFPVHVDTLALNYLQELSNLCIESRNVRVKKLVENIQPVARARAIAENPNRPTVTLEIVHWAHSIASSSILYFDWLLEELKRETVITKDVSIEHRIMRYMLKVDLTSPTSTANKNRIINGCSVHKIGSASVYNPIWNSMLDAGILQQVTLQSDSGRTRVEYYIDPEGPGVPDLLNDNEEEDNDDDN